MAPAKKTAKKAPVKAPKASDPLFPARPRSSRIGGAIRPAQRDLSRFVKWPKYVRLQRQKTILYQRLKVPPAINQFTVTLKKNDAATTFKLLNSYRPVTAAEAKAAAGKGAKAADKLIFGLKEVTNAVEDKKCSLVVIACDVDPIELVVWLPALCTKMKVPFVIVKDKARLGALVHKKTCSVVALPDKSNLAKGDAKAYDNISAMAMEQYNNNTNLVRWGGNSADCMNGTMGLKTQAKLELRRKADLVEEEKKKKNQL